MPAIILDHPRLWTTESYDVVVDSPLTAALMPGYVAAVLNQHGIAPYLIDAQQMGSDLTEFTNQIAKIIGGHDPCLLALQLVYSFENTDKIFQTLYALKDLNPKVHLNLFGYYPTFAYNLILPQYPFIDSITLGEPEITLAELAIALKEKSCWQGTPGIAFRNDTGETIKAPYRAPIQDLDSLPFPCRTQSTADSSFIYIQGSRGCYNRCLFCYINPFYGDQAGWRGRSSQNIIQEITTLLENQRESPFYFADPNFFGPGLFGQQRAMELARLIKDQIPGIVFGFETRVNDIQERSLAMLSEAGLRYVFLGIESGSQRWLNRMKKNIRVADSIRSLQLCREYGLDISTGFIMFAPLSILEDIAENFRFLKDQELLQTPTTTCHVLYHPTFICRGHPLYSTIRQNPGTEYFLGFETFEPRVRLLCEYQANISRKILAYTQGRDLENGIIEPEEEKLLKKINSLVIEGFAQALSLALKASDLARLEGSLLELQTDSLHNLSHYINQYPPNRNPQGPTQDLQ
jgi:hypothetical protein